MPKEIKLLSLRYCSDNFKSAKDRSGSAFYGICERWRRDNELRIAKESRAAKTETLNSCMKSKFASLKEELNGRCLNSFHQEAFSNLSQDSVSTLERMAAYEAFRRCFCSGIDCIDQFATLLPDWKVDSRYGGDSIHLTVAYDKDKGVIYCKEDKTFRIIEGDLTYQDDKALCESSRSYQLFVLPGFTSGYGDMKPNPIWQSTPLIAQKECAKTVLNECISKKQTVLEENIKKVCISSVRAQELECIKQCSSDTIGNLDYDKAFALGLGAVAFEAGVGTAAMCSSKCDLIKPRIKREAITSCINENIQFLSQAGLGGQVIEIEANSYRITAYQRDDLLYHGELPGEAGLTQQQCDLKICQRNCGSWNRDSCMSRCEYEHPQPFL